MRNAHTWAGGQAHPPIYINAFSYISKNLSCQYKGKTNDPLIPLLPRHHTKNFGAQYVNYVTYVNRKATTKENIEKIVKLCLRLI